MPPKSKYTREEIAAVAFQMAKEEGMESVVARELGKRLGTSSSPIFTAFKNMEELQEEICKMAMKEFEAYVHDAVHYQPPFKWVGMKMIQFAQNEPKLFQILYMREHGESQSYDDLIRELGETVDVCLAFIEQDYGLTPKEAKIIFRQMWLHTFAICVLAAGKVCHFSEEEMSEMLSMEMQGILMLIKSGTFKPVQLIHKGDNTAGEKSSDGIL